MSEVSKEYGAALYQLAQEEQISDELLEETRAAEKIFLDNPSYLKLLDSPDLPKEEREIAVARAFASGHPYLINFLKMMVGLGYSSDIVPSFAEYRDLYRKAHNIAVATVVSAVPLSDSEKAKLTLSLSKKYGKTIEAEYKIDSSLLGGVKVEISGILLDGSVKHKLEGIREELSNLTL